MCSVAPLIFVFPKSFLKMVYRQRPVVLPRVECSIRVRGGGGGGGGGETLMSRWGWGWGGVGGGSGTHVFGWVDHCVWSGVIGGGGGRGGGGSVL